MEVIKNIITIGNIPSNSGAIDEKSVFCLLKTYFRIVINIEGITKRRTRVLGSCNSCLKTRLVVARVRFMFIILYPLVLGKLVQYLLFQFFLICNWVNLELIFSHLLLILNNHIALLHPWNDWLR